MFAILVKDVDGRRFDRYFREFKNAEPIMMDEVNSIIEHYGCKKRRSLNEMNAAKGIYEREETVVTENGERFTWAIVGGYFQD